MCKQIKRAEKDVLSVTKTLIKLSELRRSKLGIKRRKLYNSVINYLPPLIPESNKTRHSTCAENFSKCKPIFKILH